jgi:hypothetical protein
MDNGLSQLPAGAVTSVGSLPMTEPAEAVDLLATRCSTLPAWPQMPRRAPAENMIAQVLLRMGARLEPSPNGWSYRVRDGAMDDLLGMLHEAPARLANGSAVGFEPFREAFAAGRFPEAVAVKGQMVGPATLSMCLLRGSADRPFADHPALVDALGSYLARLAAWQVHRLREVSGGRPVVLSLDEPAVGCRAMPRDRGSRFAQLDAVNRVLDAIREAGGIPALHCCGEGAGNVLDELTPDVFSLDACRYLAPLVRSGAAERYLHRGGRFAFGLVPTVDRPSQLNPRTMFMQWLHAAIQLEQIPQLARRSMVTATCGLGLLEPDSAAEALRAAGRIGSLIATTAQHPPVPGVRQRA